MLPTSALGKDKGDLFSCILIETSNSMSLYSEKKSNVRRKVPRYSDWEAALHVRYLSRKLREGIGAK